MTPTTQQILDLRTPTLDDPLRIFTSACLAGQPVGVDGSTNGTYAIMPRLMALPRLKFCWFCPEAFSFGVPRNTPDCHGGNGFDVWDGTARVYDETGVDMTEGMMAGAKAALEVAQENEVELAVMMSISGACGSDVIYRGSRFAEEKQYQQGPGVTTALFMREGIPVISQRDFRALEALLSKADPNHVPAPAARDNVETEWYQAYFAT